MPVAVSEELFATTPDGVRLCYQTFGDSTGEPLVLVMGLGGPMTWWDDDFCTMLVDRGFHVLRFDNRDCGRSDHLGRPPSKLNIVKSFVGANGKPAYTLDDMAGDAFALMDELGWEAAHVAGVSMGGMIVQTMAVLQPQRVRSLVSIMSTTGSRRVGWQHPRLIPMVAAPRRGGKEDYVSTSAKMWRLIGSPAYPGSEDERRKRAEQTFERGVSPDGHLRQINAILSQPDRTATLQRLRLPAAVIHGTADKMVHISGGRATAQALRDAEFVVIDGMGHDLPPELFPDVTDVIRRTADRAASPSGT